MGGSLNIVALEIARNVFDICIECADLESQIQISFIYGKNLSLNAMVWMTIMVSLG